jgi:ElaB/YqjD/DUF883 family membrane-anchored ribosome-binding protein
MNKNDAGSSTRGVDEKLDTLKDTVKGLVEQGAQKVEEIKTKAVEVKDQAITRGSNMLARVTEVIKAHPLKSVALAFSAGFIGMRLLRRRLTSSR